MNPWGIFSGPTPGEEVMNRIESTLPSWQTLLDANGNLKPQYALSGGLDTTALSQLRNRATATTQSPWLTLMLQQQQMEEAAEGDKAARLAATSAASGRSALARSGGVSAGARERMATKSARDLGRTRLDVARAGAGSRLGLQTKEEEQKLDLLKALPQAELGAAQYKTGIDQFNTGTLIGERDKKAEYDMEKYRQKMQAWGADRTASAQENSGKK